MAQRVKRFANVQPDLRKVLRRLLILLCEDRIYDKLVFRAEDSAAATVLFVRTNRSRASRRLSCTRRPGMIPVSPLRGCQCVPCPIGSSSVRRPLKPLLTLGYFPVNSSNTFRFCGDTSSTDTWASTSAVVCLSMCALAPCARPVEFFHHARRFSTALTDLKWLPTSHRDHSAIGATSRVSSLGFLSPSRWHFCFAVST